MDVVPEKARPSEQGLLPGAFRIGFCPRQDTLRIPTMRSSPRRPGGGLVLN